MALIELRDITRSYKLGSGNLQVLKGISLEIEQGEFVAIMGPSGSGKSTLMQILGLLDRPTSGSYRLLGRDVSRLSDDEGAALRSGTIGFIFQMFNLLARTSALDNVALPMIYSGTEGRQERAGELLREVGLGDRMDHKPNQLSGGQQQRVAIARALANRPKIIFADEPTGNLASDQADDILRRLEQLNRSGITIIMVTHEPDIAAHARRVLRIKDGRVVSDELASGASEREGGGVAVLARTQAAPAASIVAPRARLAEFTEFGASAFRALIANKLRSGLSMLGILIGVAAVIAMLALGRGAQKAIEGRLSALGSNLVMIFGGAPSVRGIRGAVGGASRLTLGDADAIRHSILDLAEMYPEAEGNVSLVYKDRNWVSEMQGVTPSYESIRNASPYAGRFFTSDEDMRMERVILLGADVAQRLFYDEDPIGKKIDVNHTAFKVIGVLPVRGASAGDMDDQVLVPIRTAMRRVLGTVYLHEMALQCVSVDAIPGVMDDVRRLIRKRHRIAPNLEDDFVLRDMSSMQATLKETTQTMSLLLGIVAAISLVVGGVGIMNIMLVSVNERTREIGLRKAVGATRRAILLQFLIESATVSMIGGLAGVILGTAVSIAMTYLAGWAAAVSPGSACLAFVFSAAVGVVFGLWPARKASLLSPIEALRYE